MHLPTQDFR